VGLAGATGGGPAGASGGPAGAVGANGGGPTAVAPDSGCTCAIGDQQRAPLGSLLLLPALVLIRRRRRNRDA